VSRGGAGEESRGNKSEEATPRRLRAARADGDSGASPHAAQALAFLAAVLTLPAAARAIEDWSAGAIREAIVQAARDRPSVAIDAWSLARPILLFSVPVLLTAAVTALAATVVQTGGVLAPRRLSPDLRRLNVFEGARRLFSRDQLFTVARSFFSAALIGYLTYLGLREHAGGIAALTGRSEYIVPAGAAIALRLARSAALVGLAVGAVDLLVRRRLWLTRLRMTKEEVARERKESEGDPAWKAARARSHAERMASATRNEIGEAAVVVVGPALACALRYRKTDDAPILMGLDEGARAEATAHAAREYGVAVVEDAALAVLLSGLTVGDAIPEALYAATADVILRARGAG